jgi:putative hydrolase of the HAD superfamily
MQSGVPGQPHPTHIFFDVGGVLGTCGWDVDSRRLAAGHFGLNAEEFEARHQRCVTSFEQGRMSLAQYIDAVVSNCPPGFSPAEFREFMFARSIAFPEVVAVARTLSRTGRYRMMTLNNESAELNVYRLRHFGLTDVFSAFFSSCWLGVAKPSPRIYELALELSQVEFACAVFIDDRPENLPPARVLGMRTILFRNADQLLEDLAALGIGVAEFANHDLEIRPLPPAFRHPEHGEAQHGARRH